MEFSVEQRSEQKILNTLLRKYRENPENNAYIKGNKLMVNERTYTVEELEAFTQQEELKPNRAP